jgi:GT2 family glycosyltransferase
MKRISVIIVNWNTRQLLKDCLNSIQASDGSLIQEIIVVDNASSDGSAEMVADEFPTVMLIRSNENLGFARANNIGIERATGFWLALVNSDVVVHPECFQRLIRYLETHDEAGLVGPAIIGGDGKMQTSYRRLPTMWNTFCRSIALDTGLAHGLWRPRQDPPRTDRGEPMEVEVLNGCFWVARREAVTQVGGLDERFFFYAEDIDWCKRFGDAGWKVVFVPLATATHFGGSSSAAAPFRYSIELLRANLVYWRKHHGVPGLIFFFLLSVIHHLARLGVRSVEMVFDRGGDASYKCRRSFICLRWLFTGKGL